MKINYATHRESIRDLARIHQPKNISHFVKGFIKKYGGKGYEKEFEQIVRDVIQGERESNHSQR